MGYSTWGRKEADRTDRLSFISHHKLSHAPKPQDPPQTEGTGDRAL